MQPTELSSGENVQNLAKSWKKCDSQFWKNVHSELPGPQIQLRIGVSESSWCRWPVHTASEPFWNASRLRKSSLKTRFRDFKEMSFRSLPGLRLSSKLLFLNPHDVPDLSGPLSEDLGKKNWPKICISRVSLFSFRPKFSQPEQFRRISEQFQEGLSES